MKHVFVAFLLLAGRSEPAPTLPPASSGKGLEITSRKSDPKGWRIEGKGTYLGLVQFLAKKGEELNAPLVDDFKITSKKSAEGKLTVSLLFVELPPETPPEIAKKGALYAPGAYAARLQVIAESISPRCWLEKYSEKDGKIRIEGVAVGADPIAEFMKTLDPHCSIEELSLQSAVLQKKPEGTYRFVLEAKAALCYPETPSPRP